MVAVAVVVGGGGGGVVVVGGVVGGAVVVGGGGAVVVVVAVAVVVVVVGVGVGAVGVGDGGAVAVVMKSGDFKQKGETMNIDNLTIKGIKHIQSPLKGPGETHPYEVGKNYFIRTVTHHLTGRLIRVTSKELVLEQAAWIADDGRFMQALRDGTLKEVEPFPDDTPVVVGRGALIDAVIWKHALPREQK